MGVIYRAEDGLLGRIVAVKVLAEPFAEDDGIRRRFTHEALAAARLSNAPNTITIFDVGEHEGRPYIVMEYLVGGSLADRLDAQGAQPPGRALDWLEQAAAALDAGHAQGVVHRDVKPANLLLDDEGRIRVADFGVASAAGLDSYTAAGTVLGTAGYLSPEQARGERAGPASDCYALAVVAFELLTGTRPYERDSTAAEAAAHVNAPVPSATSAEPGAARGARGCLRTWAGESARPPLPVVRRARRRPARGLRLCCRRHGRSAASTGRRAAGCPSCSECSSPRRSRSPASHSGSRCSTTRTRRRAPPVTSRGRCGRPSRSKPPRSCRPSVTTAPPAADPTEPPPEEPTASASELNDEGFRLMQAGEFEAAQPLLEQAVAAGTGDLTEAYASYNLAFTRLSLGRCDGVLELLARSEQLQGKRKEISRLRREAERGCEGDELAGQAGSVLLLVVLAVAARALDRLPPRAVVAVPLRDQREALRRAGCAAPSRARRGSCSCRASSGGRGRAGPRRAGRATRRHPCAASTRSVISRFVASSPPPML